jgi:hypothetical protein
MMDTVNKSSGSECYTPSSEHLKVDVSLPLINVIAFLMETTEKVCSSPHLKTETD